MRTTARLALRFGPVALVAACLLPVAVSRTTVMTPYGSSLSAPFAGTEAIPHGCTQTVCDANNRCAKNPGSTTKCKSGGGTCVLQGC